MKTINSASAKSTESLNLSESLEKVFLACESNAIAIYRLVAGQSNKSLERVRMAGGSPIESGYSVVSTWPILHVADLDRTLDKCREQGFIKTCDVVAIKQSSGVVTCWYVDFFSYSRLPGMLSAISRTSNVQTDTLNPTSTSQPDSDSFNAPHNPNPQMDYEVWENNAGGLYLVIFEQEDEIAKIFGDWEYSMEGCLTMALEILNKDPMAYLDWENDVVSQLAEDGVITTERDLYNQGLGELIADSDGVYTSRMGIAGRKAFAPF